MRKNIPAEQIDINALVDVLDEGIDTVNGPYASSRRCVHEFETGLGGRAQIQITVTRDKDDFLDVVKPCVREAVKAAS